MMSVCVVLLVGYIVGTMSLSGLQFEKRALREQQTDLVKQSRDLEVAAAQARSLDKVRDRAESLPLQPITTIEYLPGNDQVASR